ncbi:Protein of unknown function DUF3425 [Ceraceosorus bombacis]|uniref:BZIP domain-containing protein n=1 Tax=Ceraceosorus bombacis TaxID=401625 RepID=A0A0P1BHW3_9BASI|nr:Protein of unknown function DUF3425 [Ceraceosorus bombacis]
MPPTKERRPPCDRFTDASATAISSGFAAVMALGPQPAGPGDKITSHPRSSASGSPDMSPAQASILFPSYCDPTPRPPSTGNRDRSRNLAEEVDGEDDSDADEDEGRDGEVQGDDKPNGRQKVAGNKKRKATGIEASADDRKAQNRIAQREFRQRKQQYIRALEARVELLSSDHDTQVDRLRWALRGLLSENNLLRSMLGNFAGFIGDSMLGGPLQKAGMDRATLEELISTRSEKTMTERWQHWPGAKESEALKQLRLDAKLPPEGLPESSRLPKPRAEEHPDVTAHKDGSVSKKRKASAESAQDSSQSSRDKSPPQATNLSDLFSMGSMRAMSPGGSTALLTEPVTASTSALPPALMTNSADAGHHFTPRDFGLGGFSATSSSGTSSCLSSFNMGDTDALLAGLFGEGPITLTAEPSRSTSSHATAPQDSPFGLAVLDAHKSGDRSKKPEVVSSASVDSSPFATSLPQGHNFDSDFPSERWQYLIHRMNAQRKQFGRHDFIATLPGVDTERIIKISAADKARLDAATLVPPGRVRSPQEISDVAEAAVQNNFQRNRSYALPEIMRHSVIQRKVPHDKLLDAIPFPGVRDNLILKEHEYNVEEVIIGLTEYTRLHGEDPMLMASWELELPFMIQYPELVDELSLINTNRWRSTRHETHIDPSSLVSWKAQKRAAKGTGSTF